MFLTILEELRRRFDFVVWGYATRKPRASGTPVMPEHFHLLVSEPRTGSLSLALQALKQRVSRRCRRKRNSTDQMALWDNQLVRAFWQRRYYDFNVLRERKHVEKLRYMHRNPVKRGLVALPEQWRWSSFSDYRLGEKGPVKIGN